jgi:fucose 4-O-acetylase-like acetyltransferase
MISVKTPLEDSRPDTPQALAHGAATEPPAPAVRDAWIDNLRVVTILLVVNMHACVTASHVGSWYFMAEPEPAMPTKLLFAVWQGHLQAFFMGLLFFLAGYFSYRSKARKGSAAFMRERLIRLGLPTLFYMLVIHPLIVFGLHPGYPAPASLPKAYAEYILSGRFVGSSGPLWFALALLVFSLVYGILPARPARMIRFSAGTLAAFGALLAVSTFAIRIVQPIGVSILNMQLCFFAQYVAAFALGIAVSQGNMLETIAGSKLAANAGKLALGFGTVALGALMVLGGPMPEHGVNPFFGGLHWQALGFAFWEQFVGLGLACGALALASAKWNSPGPRWRWLSDRAFGVYVLHAPVLVALGLWWQPLERTPLLLAAALTVGGWAGSFLVVDLVRQVRWVGWILR